MQLSKVQILVAHPLLTLVKKRVQRIDRVSARALLGNQASRYSCYKQC